MNTYKHLVDEACEDDIDVQEWKFKSKNTKGLYCDKNIALNKNLKNIERACSLAEEMGHDRTSVGNIIDMSDMANRKQEYQARVWGYNKLIGLYGLIRAFEHGCRIRNEVAEHLDVTEKFLEDAIRCYRNKYGMCVTVGDYDIYFAPQLAVLKMN